MLLAFTYFFVGQSQKSSRSTTAELGKVEFALMKALTAGYELRQSVVVVVVK